MKGKLMMILALMLVSIASASAAWLTPNGGTFSYNNGAYNLNDQCYGGHCVAVSTDNIGTDYEVAATLNLIGGFVGNEAGICTRMDSQGFGYCYSLSWGGYTQSNNYTMIGYFHNQTINGTLTYNPYNLQPGAGINSWPGNSYNIKLKVQGNTLSGKSWPAGSSEPNSWNAVFTDAQNRYPTGGLGFYTYYTQIGITNIAVNGTAISPPPLSSECPSAPSLELYPTTQSISAGDAAQYKLVVRNNNPASCSDEGNNVFWIEMLGPDTNTDSGTWDYRLNDKPGKTDGMLMKWYDLHVAPNSQQTFLLKIDSPKNVLSGKRKLGFTARAQENTYLRSRDNLVGYVQVIGESIPIPLPTPVPAPQPTPEPNKTCNIACQTLCIQDKGCYRLNESSCKCELEQNVPQPPLEEPKISCDNGCRTDHSCLPFGTRLVNENTPVYCDLSQSLSEQKPEGNECQNNYECSSNSCNSGKCIDLEKKIADQQHLLGKILDFLRSLFGSRIESSVQVETVQAEK